MPIDSSVKSASAVRLRQGVVQFTDRSERGLLRGHVGQVRADRHQAAQAQAGKISAQQLVEERRSRFRCNTVLGRIAGNVDFDQDVEDGAPLAGKTRQALAQLGGGEDLLERPAFIKENLKALEGLASKNHGIHILCGYVDRNPRSTGKALTNSVALIKDGEILKKGGKRLLPTYDVFDETRYFEPAAQSLSFQLQEKRVAVTICEDIWNVGDVEGVPRYSLDPAEALAQQGMDVFVNISASPYTLNKRAVRQKILETISTHHRVTTFYCNQVGGNDDLLFDGASMVVDQSGRLILQGKEFEPDLLLWDSEKHYEEFKGPWPSEEESILKGLVMGTRDYVAKCGFKRVLIGLPILKACLPIYRYSSMPP